MPQDPSISGLLPSWSFSPGGLALPSLGQRRRRWGEWEGPKEQQGACHDLHLFLLCLSTARQLRVPGSRQQLQRGRKESEEAGGWWALQVSAHCVPVPGCPHGLGRARRETLGCALAFLCRKEQTVVIRRAPWISGWLTTGWSAFLTPLRGPWYPWRREFQRVRPEWLFPGSDFPGTAWWRM